jgi:hypothetical protein
LLVGHSPPPSIKSASYAQPQTLADQNSDTAKSGSLAYFTLTGIVFSFFCASEDFGRVTVRTPLL